MTKHKHQKNNQKPAHDRHGDKSRASMMIMSLKAALETSNDEQFLEGEAENLEVGNDNNEGKGNPVAVSGASYHPIGYEILVWQ
ncbi:MAG: hypothetical protein MRQ07_03885 [Candidatus Midichloria sp.]|nr:hypothetical protein [Candidatus Midichloria sp.]